MRSLEGQGAPPARGRRPGTVVFLLAVALCWAVLGTTNLFDVWLWSRIGPLTWAVSGLAWLLAGTLTAVVVVALCLTRRFAAAGMALLLAGLGATAVVGVDWTSAFVHGYYRRNRADFLAVAELARTHRLGRNGASLPAGLRRLALNGNPLSSGHLFPESTEVWLPAWTGMVDGVTGYAYIGDPPAGTFIDCLGDPCVVRWSLGDGWSWVDQDVPAGTGPV